MINQLTAIIRKKNDQTGAIICACLVHILLLWTLFASYEEKALDAQFEVLNVSIIHGSEKKSDSSKKTEKNLSQGHEAKKNRETVVDNIHVHSSQESVSGNSGTKNAGPIYNPLPQIPDDLRVEAFKSEAIAHFHIDAAGNVEHVELTKYCANPRINALLLKSLKSWRFKALGVATTQEIKVKFKVE